MYESPGLKALYLRVVGPVGYCPNPDINLQKKGSGSNPFGQNLLSRYKGMYTSQDLKALCLRVVDPTVD